jgi:hypothetical protein
MFVALTEFISELKLFDTSIKELEYIIYLFKYHKIKILTLLPCIYTNLSDIYLDCIQY